MIIWLVVSTHLNKLSQIGNRPCHQPDNYKIIDRQICFFRKPSRGNRWYISLPPARLEVNPIAPDLSPGKDPKRVQLWIWKKNLVKWHGLCVWNYPTIKWPYMVEDYICIYIYKYIYESIHSVLPWNCNWQLPVILFTSTPVRHWN